LCICKITTRIWVKQRARFPTRHSIVRSESDQVRTAMPARGRVILRIGHLMQSCLRGPNATRLPTQGGLLNRERESFGESAGQEQVGRRSRSNRRELSPHGRSSQVVSALSENDKRRERELSTFCVNPSVGGNSANRRSSPCTTLFITFLCFSNRGTRIGTEVCRFEVAFGRFERKQPFPAPSRDRTAPQTRPPRQSPAAFSPRDCNSAPFPPTAPILPSRDSRYVPATHTLQPTPPG